MLTDRHLSIARAALTFFDEELTPHGTHAMRPYFDTSLGEPPTAGEIAQLRALLIDCQLKYVCCNLETSRILDDRLFPTREDAEKSASAHDGQLVSVLCTSHSP